jgi:hypothetical protein
MESAFLPKDSEKYMELRPILTYSSEGAATKQRNLIINSFFATGQRVRPLFENKVLFSRGLIRGPVKLAASPSEIGRRINECGASPSFLRHRALTHINTTRPLQAVAGHNSAWKSSSL